MGSDEGGFTVREGKGGEEEEEGGEDKGGWEEGGFFVLGISEDAKRSSVSRTKEWPPSETM